MIGGELICWFMDTVMIVVLLNGRGLRVNRLVIVQIWLKRYGGVVVFVLLGRGIGDCNKGCTVVRCSCKGWWGSVGGGGWWIGGRQGDGLW
ncbi:hypothetical protein M0R45_004768 [Rubus argutus]|uniref:Transmembrane protein n=1 Tax=Rubus argutus TaxID=59490 RepID=A0AAW1YKP6_RUBAR